MELNAFDIECLASVRNLIEKHLEKHYTIEQLAEEVGMSKSRLRRAFKEAYGISIGDFTTNARMEKAKTLLEEKRKSIKQIAASLGYTHVNNFNNAFEKKYSQRPANFRKQFKFSLTTNDKE
jgi:AraC-like DNA-binding protein